MKPPLTILVTGSRKVSDLDWAAQHARSLLSHETALRGPENITIVHGAAEGWDTVFEQVATDWPGILTDPYPAAWFDTPLLRNEHMVKLMANYYRDFAKTEVVCWAFANKWASGTGHCARKARLAGIPVIDYGVSTA